MTKTKKRSRFFAVALVAVLMLALAVPSFAEQCIAYGNTNYGLNVYGSNTIGLNRNVCMWTAQNTPAQQWYYEWCVDGSNRMKSGINRNYALNIYRYSDNLYNCDVMPWSNNLTDSAVYRSTSSTGGPYTIELSNYGGYKLTANSFSNNADVRWQYLPNTNAAWYFW